MANIAGGGRMAVRGVCDNSHIVFVMGAAVVVVWAGVPVGVFGGRADCVWIEKSVCCVNI